MDSAESETPSDVPTWRVIKAFALHLGSDGRKVAKVIGVAVGVAIAVYWPLPILAHYTTGPLLEGESAAAAVLMPVWMLSVYGFIWLTYNYVKDRWTSARKEVERHV